MARQIRYALIVATFVLLASLIYVRFPFESPPRDGAESDERTLVSTSPKIEIASSTVEVYLADTPEARARGLSGLEGLSEGEGMLFVFEDDGRHAFWMKDMRFAIDIIWISHDGVIVHIEENVLPETYPTVFSPRSEARYVVELPAGWVEKYGVRIEDVVRL